ncbi:MAG: hypothetical protein ACP5E4_02545 [Candidatus Aenigmatarchaeota archaeon]
MGCSSADDFVPAIDLSSCPLPYPSLEYRTEPVESRIDPQIYLRLRRLESRIRLLDRIGGMGLGPEFGKYCGERYKVLKALDGIPGGIYGDQEADDYVGWWVEGLRECALSLPGITYTENRLHNE